LYSKSSTTDKVVAGADGPGNMGLSATTATTSSQPEDKAFLLGSINIALKEDSLHQKSCAFLAMRPQDWIPIV
jgi:hypothetical protein